MSAKSDVHPTHRFEDWQVWPGSYDNPTVGETYPFPATPTPRLTRQTRIAGIGSCFLREMKDRLLDAGCVFIAEEQDKKAARHASAGWERLYNLFSVRQVLEYALEGRTPEPRWWITPKTGRIQDPYRRVLLYEDLAAAETEFAGHAACARSVLTSAELLILTLDYVEIWEDRETGAVICLPSGPYFEEGGDLGRYRCRVADVFENVAQLGAIHALMARHNPTCRLLLMLSPVQQWATFRPDTDIFSASLHAKAVLRVAAEDFVAHHPETSYFPAYEMAMLHRQALGLSVFATGRECFHVDRATLDHIAEQFLRRHGLAAQPG